MFLSDQDILSVGPEIIKPFNSEKVQPASYDLTLYPEILIPSIDSGPDGRIDLRTTNVNHLMSKFVMGEDGFDLRPGKCILACSTEVVTCPSDLIIRVEGKSSLGRIFMIIHTCSGFVDPGFHGQITLEIVNVGPWVLHLHPGMDIAQICFSKLAKPAKVLYGDSKLKSHYQGQMGPKACVGNRGIK